MDVRTEPSEATPSHSRLRLPGFASRRRSPFAVSIDDERERISKPAATETLVVDFRNGEAVVRHPALKEMLHKGWHIESAVPHVDESKEVKLLVRMSR